MALCNVFLISLPGIPTRLTGYSRNYPRLHFAVHKSNKLAEARGQTTGTCWVTSRARMKISWFFVQCSDLSKFHFERKSNQLLPVTPLRGLPGHATWRTWKEENHLHLLRYICHQIDEVFFFFLMPFHSFSLETVRLGKSSIWKWNRERSVHTVCGSKKVITNREW